MGDNNTNSKSWLEETKELLGLIEKRTIVTKYDIMENLDTTYTDYKKTKETKTYYPLEYESYFTPRCLPRRI